MAAVVVLVGFALLCRLLAASCSGGLAQVKTLVIPMLAMLTHVGAISLLEGVILGLTIPPLDARGNPRSALSDRAATT